MTASTKSKRLIGAHVSMAGGLDKAVQRAAKIGCNCMQIFSGSPRSWSRKLPEQNDLNKLFSEKEKLGVESIFTHALYLINLASLNNNLRQMSVGSLINELKFDSLITGSGVMVHLGSHLGKGWETIKDSLLKTLRDILSEAPSNSTLLIENSAGQKGKIASNISEIRWLLEKLNDERVGWCVDTCHAFAAGYPLVSSSKFADERHPDLLSEITRLNLMRSLKCVHLNDSKVEFDSGNDRHDNIGEGMIPSQDIKRFIQNSQISNIPIITEVPGFDNKGPDLKNIFRIKKLIEEGEG